LELRGANPELEAEELRGEEVEKEAEPVLSSLNVESGGGVEEEKRSNPCVEFGMLMSFWSLDDAVPVLAPVVPAESASQAHVNQGTEDDCSATVRASPPRFSASSHVVLVVLPISLDSRMGRYTRWTRKIGQISWNSETEVQRLDLNISLKRILPECQFFQSLFLFTLESTVTV
jgi:hypothetical protein